MKWSIFSRLMTGYLAVLLLAMGVSVYAIVQLTYVRDVTKSVILVDNPLLDLHKGLSDSLLSQQRYEKKYIIMQDDLLYRGFLASKAEFEQYLRTAQQIAESPQLKSVLERAAGLHHSYQELFDNEVRYLSTGRRYPVARYRTEKETMLNALTDELMNIRSLSQQSIFGKVKKLSEAGTRATRAAIVTTVTAVGVGIILSFFITGSITKPLAEMQTKMSEFSSGIREPELNISSPPEIAKLGRSFNLMCEKLKELDRLKADFYALMSHELRTPLSSIKESTNLFLEGRGGSVTETQKKLLSITAEESNRMIELVNSLLDISKLEAGMMAYHFSQVDLNTLIAQAVKEVTPLAEAKRIRIEKKLAELPLLSLDPERILQVLRNLIGNALKFTPANGFIAVSSFSREKGVSVTVTDTGPGISQEHAAIIFDKYRQAGVSGQNKLQGTGLGLAVVKYIVQHHGGSVWVESDGARGSTFTVALPL